MTSNSSTLPRILLLFLGGSISMRRSSGSGALEPHYGPDQLLELAPRMADIAVVETQVICNVDGTDLAPSHWEILVETVATRYEDFDGFLVTGGTNTLAYVSSALTFALLGIGKPVVMTGAQIPAEEIHSDAHNNLINALRVASMDLAGVFVVFGSRIILGCRAKKLSESELDAFTAFQASSVGRIGATTTLSPQVTRRHGRAFRARNGFESAIDSLTLFPGKPPAHLSRSLADGVRGLVLRAYGSGDIPSDLRPVLEEARARCVPIVVTTQCPRGATTMGHNDVGRLALKTGVIEAYDMSLEAMTTKLMWLLGQGTPYSRIRDLMMSDLAGELSRSEESPSRRLNT